MRNIKIQRKSFDSVPKLRLELHRNPARREGSLVDVNGISGEGEAIQAVGREEDELAIVSGHCADEMWPVNCLEVQQPDAHSNREMDS